MDRLQILIHERLLFEDEMYDVLISPLFIPDDFWEPVIVCLTEEQIESMKDITKNEICFICDETMESFKELPCCIKTCVLIVIILGLIVQFFVHFVNAINEILFNLNNFI